MSSLRDGEQRIANSALIGRALERIAEEGDRRFTASYVASLVASVPVPEVAETLHVLAVRSGSGLEMLCEAVCPCGEPVGAIAPCSEVLGRQVYCEESGTWFEATPEHVRYWFRLAGTGVAAGSKKKEKTR